VRVLHCIDSLRGGGAERQLTLLVEGLVRLGHEVRVVYMLDGAHGARLRRSGAALHPLGMRTHLPLVVDLVRIIREHRVDVVQTWLQRMSVAGGLASALARRPWVYSERSVRLLEPGWRAALRHRLAAHADAIVANSETGAGLWRPSLRDPRKVRVVLNGIDLAAIAATPPAPRRALGIADDAEVVLFVGRLVAPKNVPLLAAALIALLGARPRAVALVCGDGAELPWLRAAVGRAGLGDRCRTLGYREDVWALAKLADVLIAPSLNEGRPNAVLEAVACHCPVALSSIPQHRECVPAAGALWFSPQSPDEAVAALARALDDRTGARTRAEVAFAAVRGQSIEVMARAYHRVYRHVYNRASV
jgi:glycosyltransferase involved in cell wall biosynthesis